MDETLSTIADRLYPDLAKGDSTAPSRRRGAAPDSATPERSLAEQLYPDNPVDTPPDPEMADTTKPVGPTDAEYAAAIGERVDPEHDLSREAFAAFAEHGIKPEVAQQLVDLHQRAAQARAAEDAELISEIYRDAARNDRELNDGAGYEANLAAANRIVARYADAELRHYLRTTPTGNWPPLVRFLARVARDLY